MENGLAYMVPCDRRNNNDIVAASCSDSHVKMNPYIDPLDTISDEEMELAVHNLKTLDIAGLEYWNDRFEDETVTRWLKWTRKYQAEIHNLTLYYAEKAARGPTRGEEIPIDFTNRDYTEIAGYWPGVYVCFVMKNGLSYLVNLEKERFYIDVHPYAFFNDYGAFFEEADGMPEEERENAIRILQNAPLPELDRNEVRSFQFWFQLHKK